MASSRLFRFLFVVVLSVVIDGGQDLTREEKQKGDDVVTAVVDQIRDNCIFSQDRLFLQRLALVESDNGRDPKTYRKGFYGGIWQVDESKFRQTIHCRPPVSVTCDRIMTSLNITWQQVKWRDLLKPLYSGLAASLYVQLKSGISIPGDVTSQALLWKRIYSPNESVDVFTRKADVNEPCKTNLDLVFIVDTSGSIGASNFIRVQNFLVDVVRGLDISANHTRVATVSFSSSPYVDFDLSEYSNVNGVVNGINNVYYDGGGTNTDAAIKMAANEIFAENHGMRKDSKKVALLVTDGYSYSMNSTVAEAWRAKDHGIVFFAVGVGDVNDEELRGVATDPKCTHVFLLANFSEIQTLLHEIRRSACRAQISQVIRPEKQTNITKSIPLNVTVTFTAAFTKENNTTSSSNTTHAGYTVMTTVKCGVVQIYTSYETTHPGPAFHDLTDTATDVMPSYIVVNNSMDGRPLYVTYVGKHLPNNVSDIGDCKNTPANIISTFVIGKPEGLEVVCREHGTERECTKLDFMMSKYKKYLCTDTFLNVENPCSPTALSNNQLTFPHPYDNSKFIRCDYNGDMYITQCPPGKLYNAGTTTCGSQHQVTSYGEKQALPANVSNPCTPENIMNGNVFFSYPPDKRKFIYCDSWGYAHVLSCRHGDIWYQNAQMCSLYVATNSPGNATSSPDFSLLCSQGGEFFHHPSDPHKYINCGPDGFYYVQACPIHMVFDLRDRACVRQHDIGTVIG